MPATLASLLLNFLATHLVVVGLVGFLLTGLYLGGVLGGGQASSARAERTPASTQAEHRGDGPLAPATAPGKAAAGVEPVPGTTPGVPAPGTAAESPRPAPRFIGGTLPNYAAGPAVEAGGAGLSGPGAAAAGEPGPGGVDGTFRPPDDGLITTPRMPAAASRLPAEPEPGPEPGREELVQDARRAFWNGDFEAAEAAYLGLLSRLPGDADAFGELGNLYQQMGKPQQALDAYYEAAIRLKASGRDEKFNKIIALLEKRGDPRAQSLRP